MIEIVCQTGDSLLDEMGEIIIRNAAEGICSSLGEGKSLSAERIVMTFRGEEAEAGDILILLYRGEKAPVCTLPMSIVLRCPYSITELEKAVRELLFSAVREKVETGESTVSAEESPSAEPRFVGRRVSLGDVSVQLTKKEAALFSVLYENRGTAVPRDRLAQAVWGREVKTNLCDVYVCRLRTVLEPIFGKGFLVNLRKDGYMLV